MKKQIKKTVAALVAAVLLLGAVPAFAVNLPHAIWAPLSQYTAAQESGDDVALLNVGKQLLSIMDGEPASADKTSFLYGKYFQMAKAAERLGRYEEAVDYYKKYIPYAEQMGNAQDGIFYAERKIMLLAPSLDVYYEAPAANAPYYGAKFEPRAGIYFGEAYKMDNPIDSGSVMLVYLEYHEDITQLGRFATIFQAAKDSGKAILLAWNTYDSMAGIEADREKIQKTIDFIASYDIPVFLRFANEMNVGPNGGDPQSYINAFRFVASIAKQKEQIAMVWAPNDVGATDRPFENYYPGDEYVDWIGVSCYTQPYFNGVNNASANDNNHTGFISGPYANPLKKLAPIMEFMAENNIQKPVMIAEGGDSNYLTTMQEDATSFAALQMRRRYTQLCRAYPNLKLICQFNTAMSGSAAQYVLTPELRPTYDALTNTGYYLETFGTSSPHYYAKLEGALKTDGNLSLSAVPYYPIASDIVVEYVLDGNPVLKTDIMPYACRLENLAAGSHSLTVNVYTGVGRVQQKNYTLVSEPKIHVVVNGEAVVFPDQEPQIVDGRTLIPARGVFEKMGAAVTWNGDARTVTVEKDGTVVVLQIDNPVMQVNGRVITLDVPPQILSDRTVIPVRAVAEALSAEVGWDQTTRTVTIHF